MIFSSSENYECNIRRIISRGETLTDIYKEKSIFIGQKNCNTNILGKVSNLEHEHKKKVFERMIELYKKDLIAQEEFDVIRNDKDLAEINVRIAEKELENVSTGEKPEHIKMITEQINKNKMIAKSKIIKYIHNELGAPYK